MLIEKIWGLAVLATCALLLVRLLLGDARRDWLDGHLLRGWLAVNRAARAVVTAVVTSVRRVWNAPAQRRRDKAAAQAAAEAAAALIARARDRARNRDGVEQDGNVYKPKSFRKPPPDTLH